MKDLNMPHLSLRPQRGRMFIEIVQEVTNSTPADKAIEKQKRFSINI